MIGQATERTSPMGGFGKTFGLVTAPQSETKIGQTARALGDDIVAAEHQPLVARDRRAGEKAEA